MTTVSCSHCGETITFDPARTPIEEDFFGIPDALSSGRYVVKCPNCGKERTYPMSDKPQSYEPPKQQPNPDAPRLRVLVVDDEPDTAETQAQLIEALGFEAKACLDASTALQAFIDFRPDVALLDIGLPGTNGFELAKQLLTQPKEERPLVIALTGYRRDSYRQRSQEIGIHVYLTKPAAPSDLLGVLCAEAERRGRSRKVEPSRIEQKPLA